MVEQFVTASFFAIYMYNKKLLLKPTTVVRRKPVLSCLFRGRKSDDGKKSPRKLKSTHLNLKHISDKGCRVKLFKYFTIKQSEITQDKKV